MAYQTKIYCNCCRVFAPNPNRIPHGWIEFKSIYGGTYHYCKVCVVGFVAMAIGVKLDRSQPVKAAGEVFILSRFHGINSSV